MNYRYLIYVLLLSCLALSFAAKPITKSTSKLPSYCPTPLILAYYGDWYPYMFELNERYLGSDWQLLWEITTELGCKMRVKKIPEKRAHQVLMKNEPIVMIGATYTERRAKYAHFSSAYREETMSIFYLHSPSTISRDTSLFNRAEHIVSSAHFIVINDMAWYGDTIQTLRNSKLSKKFHHVTGLDNRVEMLARDRADTLVEDHYAGCDAIYRHANIDKEKVKILKVNRSPVSYMFSRHLVTPEFIHRFNQLLMKKLEQGVYQRLVNRYVPTDCAE